MSDDVRIRKVPSLMGRTLRLRNADEGDASFILALRTNERKAAHLSTTAPSLERQIEWLRQYATSSNQAYFIIENSERMSLGTVRLYDAQGNSFCWGSWILMDGAPAQAAIESALMVYVYALDHLGFERSHFQVRKRNERVWAFHERFGAQRVGEDENEYEYVISNESIRSSLERYSRYLPQMTVTGPLT